MSSQSRRYFSKRRPHTRSSHPHPRKTSSSSFPPRTMCPTGLRSPSGDSFTCAVAHRDADGKAILDCLHEVRAPFDPAVATREIAATLKAYGITKVVADKYAAQWPVAEFSCNNVTLEHSERDRSAIYADFLPLLTSGRARLIDAPRLIGQFCNLERRAQPSGKDRIDHPVGSHDDLSNSAAGALVLAADWSSYDGTMDWVGAPANFADQPYFSRMGIGGGCTVAGRARQSGHPR
jgi:hypothetical protein